MKVLCIDTIKQCYTKKGKKSTMPPVYIGNYYTVVGRMNWFHNGKDWLLYELEEIKPNPMKYYYASDLFAECGVDVDELELVNTKEECV